MNALPLLGHMPARIRNLAAWRGHLFERLAHQVQASGDPALARLADDIVAWLAGGPALPPRAVAVTFDDGFRDVLEEAAPLLAEAGVPGAALARMAGTGTPDFSSMAMVGLRPTMLLSPAGTRPEPAVSVPSDAMPNPAATAAALPVLDAPGAKRAS